MIHRPPLPTSLSRWPVWTFALVLLLKAAVPMLATAAAHAQGKSLVEVCTVYGVSTIVIDEAGTPSDPAGSSQQHADEHCVLGGVLSGAVLDGTSASAPPHAQAVTEAPRRVAPACAPPDACAAWVARLQHGPPRLA